MTRLAPTEAARKQAANTTTLKRLGQKSEVASLAAFLASEHASYITGTTVSCDGGLGIMGARAMGA